MCPSQRTVVTINTKKVTTSRWTLEIVANWRTEVEEAASEKKQRFLPRGSRIVFRVVKNVKALLASLFFFFLLLRSFFSFAFYTRSLTSFYVTRLQRKRNWIRATMQPGGCEKCSLLCFYRHRISTLKRASFCVWNTIEKRLSVLCVLVWPFFFFKCFAMLVEWNKAKRDGEK